MQLINRVRIGSDNGLSPLWHQAIIQTNAGLLSIGLLGTNFSEILIKIQTFSFTKMHLKLSSAKWQPFCPRGDDFRLMSSWVLCIPGSYVLQVSTLQVHWYFTKSPKLLTHWGRVTPGRRQAIIWTNAGILLIGPLGTNFSEILKKLLHFHTRKSIGKCRLENGGHFVLASMC